MNKYALWTISSRKFHTIIGLSMIPMFVGLGIAIWALFTGNMDDKWVFPVSAVLFHICQPITLGVPFFSVLGAIDVKYPPKRTN